MGNQVLHGIIIVIQSLELVMNFCVLFFLLIRKNEFQQRLLIFMAFATAIYNLALLSEILPFTSYTLIYYAKCIETIAVGMFQLPFLIFCFQYIGISIKPFILRLILTFYGIIAVSQFIDAQGWYYYKSVKYVEDASFPHLDMELGFFGILFWVFMVFAPVIVDIVALSYGLSREKDRGRRKTALTFLIQIVFAMVVFFAALPLIYTTGYNPLMLFVGFALCTKIFLSWRNQGLDIISIAAKSTLDSIGQPVIVLESDGKILYYNASAKEVVEDIDRFAGRNVKEFIQYSVDQGYAVGPHEFVKDDMYYHSQWSPVIDDDGESVGQSIAFINVTAERMAMEEMKQEKVKADEANAAKSIFLANMSHEIRTPMNAIIGMSELIIEESRGRKVYDMAVQIKKASKNLLTIINNILDYSKMEAGKMDLVEDNYYLEEMVVDTFNLINIPAKERGLQVNLELDENLPCELFGDDGKIRQVLINLLNNAIKFTKKGHIDLTVNGQVRGDYVQLILSVSDTGSGISEENQRIIFESFEQVDKINNKSVEGTGLGLSITKGLVDMMDGKIALSSVYGEGSTFSVSVPQRIVDITSIRDNREVYEEEEQVKKQFISPRTKVLICDDNKINILVISGMLESYELDIDSCNSGKDAISLVEKIDYDIIMMDHMMPEMDGIEATSHIRTICSAKRYKPYIIALTANSYEGAHDMFVSRGFDDFIAKPVDKMVLYDKLLKIIPEHRREFVEADVAPATYTEDELAELFMKGVDVRSAVDNRGGSISDYLKLLELYYLEGTEKLREIRETYNSRDFKNYEIYVHGLKSTSGAIGATGLSNMAKDHEYAAKEQDIKFIDDNYEHLCKEYDRILGEIENVLTKKGIVNSVSDEDKLDGMTKEMLEQGLKEILELSQDFQSKEAATKLQELLKYKHQPAVEDELEEIAVRFKMYDDDGAEEGLINLLDNLENLQEG